jgi:hypothetical protein
MLDDWIIMNQLQFKTKQKTVQCVYVRAGWIWPPSCRPFSCIVRKCEGCNPFACTTDWGSAFISIDSPQRALPKLCSGKLQRSPWCHYTSQVVWDHDNRRGKAISHNCTVKIIMSIFLIYNELLIRTTDTYRQQWRTPTVSAQGIWKEKLGIPPSLWRPEFQINLLINGTDKIQNFK